MWRSIYLFFVFSLLNAKPLVVSQGIVHKFSCGPCALVNQLQLGTEKEQDALRKLKGSSSAQKAKEIIKRYGKRQSPNYRDGRPVFREDGMSSPDLLRMVNWLRGDKSLSELAGDYLNRAENEELEDHLARVHRQLKESLDSGTKPIISFRSFTPKYYDELEEWLWSPLMGHFVTVISVPDQIEEEEKGFRFRFADSATGKIETGYAHLSEARNFVAQRGDKVNWEWKKDRPFLLVTAPSLRLKTQKSEWFLRTIITLDYGIYASDKEE